MGISSNLDTFDMADMHMTTPIKYCVYCGRYFQGDMYIDVPYRADDASPGYCPEAEHCTDDMCESDNSKKYLY